MEEAEVWREVKSLRKSLAEDDLSVADRESAHDRVFHLWCILERLHVARGGDRITDG